MKKTVSVLLAVVLLAAIALSTVSCGGAKKLVGTWKDENGGLLVFSDDGKVSIKSEKGLFSNLSVDGTYTVDGKEVTITYKVLIVDTNFTYTFKVKGKTLTLTDDKGNESSYTKSK